MLQRLAIATLLLFLQCQASADTTLYRVSKSGSELYLGGTIHLLRTIDYPLPKEFDDAYQHASQVYFETDLGKVNDPMVAQQLAIALMYTDGKTLATDMEPKNWQALKTFAAERQFPIERFTMFKAVFVSLMFTVAELQKLGMGSNGVDMHFYQQALKDKKAIGELETVDDMLTFMRSTGDLKPDDVMASTMRDLTNIQSLMREMLKHWRAGDLKKLDGEMGEQMRKESPELYQTLVVQRNQKWLKVLEKVLATPETELVLVGALHLPGDQGLLHLLEKQGYKIEPYRITPKTVGQSAASSG